MRRAGAAGRSRSPPTAARGWTRCGPRWPTCCPTPRASAEPPEPAGVVVHRLEAAGDGFTVEREDDAYRVRGKRIERLAAQTNFENEESAERFQRELVRTGIDGALRKAGIRPGDTVRIGAHGAGVGAARGRPCDRARGPRPSLAPAAVVPGSLGVLGGTFDPIHHGHLAIAEDAREALGLERVLLVPAARPPHKPGRPVDRPREHRLAMVELAIDRQPGVPGRRDGARRGAATSYTVDTLEALRGGGDRPTLWFILSSEALAGFAAWREPDADPRPRPARGRAAGRRPTPLDAAWVAPALPGPRGPRPVPAGAPVAHLR